MRSTDGWVALGAVGLLIGVLAGALLLLAATPDDNATVPPTTALPPTAPDVALLVSPTRAAPPTSTPGPTLAPSPTATATRPLPSLTPVPPSASPTPTPTVPPSASPMPTATVPPTQIASPSVTMTLTSQPLPRTNAVILLSVTPVPGAGGSAGVTGPVLADRVARTVRAEGCDDPSLRVVAPVVGSRAGVGTVVRGTANVPGQARYQLRLEAELSAGFTPLIDATVRVVNGRLGVVRRGEGQAAGVTVLVLEAFDARDTSLGQCRIPVVVD